jgi:uncharacterized protein
MSERSLLSRRDSLRSLGAAGAAVFCGTHANGASAQGAELEKPPADIRELIFAKVRETALIDTHEHLCDESDRLAGKDPFGNGADDWTLVFSHYLDSDLRTAGMPPEDCRKFFRSDASPREKWKLIEPYWPAAKNTGYAQAVRHAMRELYGVDELSADTVDAVQAGYVKTRRKGFYERILRDLAKIESCQVNSTLRPFNETNMPTLLMQDLALAGMFAESDLNSLAGPTGINVTDLSSWHRVIDWWFQKYGRRAVAVKCVQAYSRDIDYAQVPAERAEGFFKRKVAGETIVPEDQKALEDHLFWYAAEKAAECYLPIKVHTGYYAGDGYMPLSRLMHNAASACDLCRAAPNTRFVFMHICYPYYEEMLSVAKHYANAYIDMCWSWIINPVAAKDFLKKYLVTAPANKLLTFGGDYLYVEPVLGHAMIARHGIAQALSELVEEQWLSASDALGLIEPIMNGNARRIFRLEEKQSALLQPA